MKYFLYPIIISFAMASAVPFFTNLGSGVVEKGQAVLATIGDGVDTVLGDHDPADDRAKKGKKHSKKDSSKHAPKASKSIMGMTQAADPEDCVVKKNFVVIPLDASSYPESALHIDEVRASGDYPKYWHIDREGADHNRELSLAGIPTKDGYDRDEIPMATTSEGGEGADIKYVPYSDNRGAGSSIGNALAPYCSGQAFIVRTVG